LNNSGLALLFLFAITVVVAGLAVENYCQLVRHYAAKDCVPILRSRTSGVDIFGPRPRPKRRPYFGGQSSLDSHRSVSDRGALATSGGRATIGLFGAFEMDALGVSLLVSGTAFLFSGLVFLIPTERKLSSRQKAVEESQKDIEFYLEQLRKQRNEF
jgi:hypothetical protein